MVDGVNQIPASSSDETAKPETTPSPEATPFRVAPPPSGWHRVGQGLMLGAVFAVTAAVSAGFGAWLTLVAPLPPQWLPEGETMPLSLGTLLKRTVNYEITRPVNILVMGIDLVPGATPTSAAALAGRTDTMLLVRLDPSTQTLNVLSIPRDTQVSLARYGTMKINQANVLGGPSFAARVVSQTLNDVPIDRYVRVNTEAFRELVDLVGGVEVFVPESMQYTDRTQSLYIDLPQGWQTLNGDQAEQFARFRSDAYGDIGRVQRQQSLLKALRERLVSPAIVPKLPDIMRLSQRYVDTNLSVEELLAIADYTLDLESENLRMVMLPGRFSTPEEYIASYWLMDPEATQQVVQRYFQSEIAPVAVAPGEVVAPTELRIAVQNATATPQVGRQVANYLREQGFSNVYVTENWPDTTHTTTIIVQGGDLDGAKILQSTLGLGRIWPESTGAIGSDLTLRIGADWVEQQRHATDPAMPEPAALQQFSAPIAN